METHLVHQLTATFEGHAQQTETGVEYWLARDLQLRQVGEFSGCDRQGKNRMRGVGPRGAEPFSRRQENGQNRIWNGAEGGTHGARMLPREGRAYEQ